MFIDQLREYLNKILTTCEEKGIAVFYGEESRDLKYLIRWTDDQSQEKKLASFVLFLAQLSPRFIVIEIITNSLELDSGVLRTIVSKLNPEDTIDFQKKTKQLESRRGQIASFRVLLYEGYCFEFQMDAGWSDDLCSVLEQYNAISGDENVLEMRSRINSVVQAIISDPEYAQKKNKEDREFFSMDKAQALSVQEYDTCLTIAYTAEKKYQEMIRPKKEAELKDEIQNLKSKGHKKVQICGILGITISTLNKYYY